MSNKPTTREILDRLYKSIEERQTQHRKKAYSENGPLDIAAEARMSECGIILAMITGTENEYNI